MPQQRNAPGEFLPFFAMLASWIAMGGSLYFSEGMKWPPCTLCWWQRAFMYPMALLFPFAIYLRWRRMWRLFIPLALIGLGIALYHQGFVFSHLFAGGPLETTFALSPCSADGPPCGVDLLQILLRNNYGLGFISIPGLAMIAFAMILISMVLFARKDPYCVSPESDEEMDAAAA
jgi:disulfide bond formation protein DsbB